MKILNNLKLLFFLIKYNMVKAQDLIKKQKERELIKYTTFEKIYNNIEKKINLASASNYYYAWYEIPQFLIGYPMHNLPECKTYITEKLSKNGFTIEDFNNNIILIKWFS